MPTSYTITATASNATTDRLTINTTDNMFPGLPIVFSGPVFGGITAGATYYIGEILVGYPTSTITLTSLPGGATFGLTTASGSMTGTFVQGGQQIIPTVTPGQPLNQAFGDINTNFDQVFAAGPVLSNVRIANNTISTTNTNGNLVLAPNGIGTVVSNVSIVPNTANIRNLGSATQRWSTVYTQYLDLSGALTTGDLTVDGNLTVQGNIIQVGNIVTETLTIQLANAASTANAANGAGITVGANDNIATILYSSTANRWNLNIGLSATGNITAPYFLGNGSQLTGVTASGVAAAALTGNTLSTNVLFSSLTSVGTLANLSVSGNVTGGNILTAGRVSTTGNITGNYFIGNGSQLTGLAATYGNANVVTLLSGFGSNAISTTGNITAGNVLTGGLISATGNVTGNYFIGNGSQLTGIVSSYGNSNVTTLLSNLGSNTIGGTGNITTTANISGGNLISATLNNSGNISVVASGNTWTFGSTGNLTVPGNIIPQANVTYSLGDATHQWKDLYVSGNTIYFNNVPVSMDGNTLSVDGRPLYPGVEVGQPGNVVLGSPINANGAFPDIPVVIDQVTLQLADPSYAYLRWGHIPGIYTPTMSGGTSGNITNIVITNPGLYPLTDANTWPTINTDNMFALPSGTDISDYANIWAAYQVYVSPYGPLAANIASTTTTVAEDGFIYLTGNTGLAPTAQDNGMVLTVNTGAGPLNWTLDSTGNLTLPLGGIVYETSIPGGVLTGNAIALKPQGGTDADQQLLIYPTALGADANHLHLTSGNLYNTELFLGNDDLYVKLANTGNILINSNDSAGNIAQWTFDTTGNLTVPASNSVPGRISTQTTLASEKGFDLRITAGNTNGCSVPGGDLYLSTGVGYNGISHGRGNVNIVTGDRYGNINGNIWRFDSSGALTLPLGNIKIKGTVGNSIAFGLNAGQISQGTDAVAIGSLAGNNRQGNNSVAIGNTAGAGGSVSTNYVSGAESPSTTLVVTSTTGIGPGMIISGTGFFGNITVVTVTNSTTLEISASAGFTPSGVLTFTGKQGANAVAIGQSAGLTNQGTGAVAIGASAGYTNQGNNSIILNATGANLDQTTANTFTVAPVRNDVANVAQVMFYNTTSKEITYGNVISVAGNITGNYIFGNGSQLTGLAATYGNANVANYLPTFSGNISAGNVSATGNVTGTYIKGNGSELTSLPAPVVTQDITSNGAMSIMTYDGVIKYVNYATVEPSSGNISAGNLLTIGNVSGNYFIGNGSQLTGISSANTGNVTFNNQAVVGTGDQEGSSGLYLAPGTQSVGNLQYIRVRGGDVATHIHLDTGNNAYFDQYFGDDGKYVKLEAAGNIVINTNDGVGNSAQWTFNNFGRLTLPGGSQIRPLGANLDIIAGTGSYVNLTTSDESSRVGVDNTGGYITTAGGTWNFGTTGNLTAPGNISATGNITGGNIITAGNISGNTAGFAIGYRDIPQVSFTANATIATTDAGKHYYSTLSTGNVLTIANNASQGFQVGAAITVINQGTGNITVAQGSGVTLYLAGNATSGNRIVATFGMATLIKVATDTWFINGTGVT